MPQGARTNLAGRRTTKMLASALCEAEARGKSMVVWSLGLAALAMRLSLRVLIEETYHLRGGIWAFRIGV
jgi:hypothetical protein